MSDLFIDTRGHGPLHIVMLHGWAMHGGIFAPLIQALEDRATLHIVDLPGHGHSRDSDVPLAPAACARAIAGATPPALWLGWSMGGLIALRGALDHPGHVHGLAMLCASPRFGQAEDWPHGMAQDTFNQFSTDLDADYRATVERFLALEAMGSEGARQAMRDLRRDVFARGEPDPRVLKDGLSLLDKTDMRAELNGLEQPSAWIAGRRDRLVPWQAMQRSADICHGRFTCIDHAGHAPFIGFADPVVQAMQPLLDALAP